MVNFNNSNLESFEIFLPNSLPQIKSINPNVFELKTIKNSYINGRIS